MNQRIKINIALGIFLLLTLLFYQFQFSTYPQINDKSNRQLITDGSGLPKKVILIIIDSLRYDYLNRLPFFHQVGNKYPNSSFTVKCSVGSPTMTTQRIQALMTGSQIFSSGNILQSFLASKVKIDNIITQLSLNNKTSIVFGDDTWTKLFQFTHSKVCPNTFDVHDYDSCDKIIYKYLSSGVAGKDKNEIHNFMIGHFLALDHVGHSTSSITEKIMDTKIQQISTFLNLIANNMDNDTMMLVTGDHGMRSDGNHGGNTAEQTETLLFGYFKNNKLFKQKWRDTVTQSDITITLSVLLNISLPSNTVGFPILKAIPQSVILNKQNWKTLNQELYLHYLYLLKFYNQELTAQQTLAIEKYIQQEDFNTLPLVQQSICKKLYFLKYSSPNTLVIIGLITLLVIVAVFLGFSAFAQELSMLFTFKLKKKSFCMKQMAPSLILFMIYFSWLLIQNLSHCLALTFIIFSFIGVFDSQIQPKFKLKTIFIIFINFFTLAQIQPSKVNDYKTGFLRIDLLHNLLQNKIITGLISSIILIFYLRHTLRNERHHPTSSKSLIYLKMLLLIMNYINYITTNFGQQIYYSLRIIIFTISIVWLLAQLCISKSLTQQYNKHQQNAIIFIFLNMLSIFMGHYSPIILLSCYYIQKYSCKCKNYTILISLLSECVWWWMGNRYEYSGIDVMKSYVFSQEYIPFLNAISLLIYLLSPFIVIWFLLSFRMKKQIEQITSYSKVESKELSSQSANDRQLCLRYVTTTNLKYIIMYILGFLSCAWNVYYNNQKILFTVVYVPMLLFCSIKCIGIILLTSLSSIFITNSIKTENKYFT